MDAFVRSSPILQLSASARRPARRWPRRGTPLRWASASRRTPPGKPPGGSGAPPSGPRPIPAEDAAWLLRVSAPEVAEHVAVAVIKDNLGLVELRVADSALEESFLALTVGARSQALP